MKENKKTSGRLGALDIMIIIALLVCVVSVGLRFFMSRSSDLDDGSVLEDYIVTFEVLNIRDSSAKNYLKGGMKFFLDDTGEYIGTLREEMTTTDAEKRYNLTDGSVISVANSASGDLYRVDVECSLNVSGKLDNDGHFLLGGNKYLGIGKEVKIHSKYQSITVVITDIAKAG